MAGKMDAILIAGPTASGKSALALRLAEENNGTIINTDSMQVYPVLRVLTARPEDDDLARAPHLLYGHADIAKPYSVAQWMADAEAALASVRFKNRMPIFVGGTGLYFRALTQGLAKVPVIGPAIRDDVRQKLVEDGSEALHRQLQNEDPVMASRLHPSDGQRIARALEVVRETGRSLDDWQKEPNGLPLVVLETAEKRLILPNRETLHKRIDNRAAKMLDGAALDEVRALRALDLPADATVLKAIGVEALSLLISGEIGQETALERLQATTKQYAKRQSTWFRNQFDDSWEISSD